MPGHLRSSLIVAWQKIVAGRVYRILIERAFLHKDFMRVASEFLLEAGVLCLVFPILDTIVQFGRAKVTARMTLASVGIAVGCLWMAGILSREEKEPGDKR